MSIINFSTNFRVHAKKKKEHFAVLKSCKWLTTFMSDRGKIDAFRNVGQISDDEEDLP